MLAVCCLLLSALCLRAELAFKWTVEVSQPLPYSAEALQGESFNLEAKVVQYRVPMLEAATATFYYQTPEMDEGQWYATSAQWDALTATVKVAFTPAMDVGSTKYRFFFGIETAQGKNYRVFGTLRLKASPGFSPATLTPVDVRQEIVQEVLKAVFAEVDGHYATLEQLNALEGALDGKAEANHTHADVARYDSADSNNAIGKERHGAVLFSAVNSGKGGFYVGGSEAATPSFQEWLARYQNQGITVFRGSWGLSDYFSFDEGENQIARKKDLPAAITVDSTLSANSKNPVQNKAVYSALNNKAENTALAAKADGYVFNSSNDSKPYIHAHGASTHALHVVFDSNNEADNWAEDFDNAKVAFEWWHQYDNVKEDAFEVPITAFRALAAGGGGNTEVWRDNVGFGAQDTFFGPKAVAADEGQFYKGYPRLHNHGQDIHEVSGFSRDSRDDEDVWSHRLLLPWDLAKANDTSYLMAGVVWDGNRNIVMAGDTTTFVQPLVPTNKGNNTAYVPYALPCFENSPMFWKGQMIWHDGTTTLSKSVSIPWSRVKGTTAAPSELALKSDVDAKVEFYGGSGNSFTLTSSSKFSLGFTIWDETIDLAATRYDGYQGTVTLPLTSVTDDLASRIDALEANSGGGGEPVPREGCSISWQDNTSLLTVTPDLGGSIGFDTFGWPEGRSLLVRLTTSEDFELPETVRLVGYFDLEPSSTYQLTAYVIGGVMHLVPLLKEE